jgi:hypothetical protein
VFAYNQPCTFTLASIIQRNANMLLTRYVRPRLFDPLGIGEVGWQTYNGRERGYTGLHARTEDVAKLGQLYLLGGRWNGSQLLAPDWVAQATSKQVDNPNEANPDWRQGYGFQFWMARHGYRGDGAFGQFCVILPQQDAVVVTTASTLDMQAVLDAMWAHLLPALGRPSADERSQTELASRLENLELAANQADPEPSDWEAWLREPFRVPSADGGTLLTSVEVLRASETWHVRLNQPENALSVPVGTRGWTLSAAPEVSGKQVPVAASGGWSDQKTLRVEVIFLETPHRMDILCSLDDRCATAAWRLPPLGSSQLQDLRSPH